MRRLKNTATRILLAVSWRLCGQVLGEIVFADDKDDMECNALPGIIEYGRMPTRCCRQAMRLENTYPQAMNDQFYEDCFRKKSCWMSLWYPMPDMALAYKGGGLGSDPNWP